MISRWRGNSLANTVADGRNVQRRQRIHVARRQAAETASTQSGLLLLLKEGRQILPHSRQRLLYGLPDPEIDETVAEMRSRQELRRKIGNSLGVRICFGNRSHGGHIALHHAVANGICERHVPV